MGWLAALIALAAGAPAARGEAPSGRAEATPKQVDDAIRKGAAWLWSKQKPDGRWEDSPKREGTGHDFAAQQGDTWGGYSALATYALLSAGEKRQDPRMIRAVNFLKGADIVGTYAVAMRCQVWHQLNTNEARKLLSADAARLLAGLGKEGEAQGMWGYLCGKADPETLRRWDHSVSQYGVLGLWAAAQGGTPIAPASWRLLDDAWRRHQGSDGGWGYAGAGQNGNSSSLTMGAAGVATLFITQDMLGTPPGSLCNGNPVNPNITRGMEYLVKDWGNLHNAYLLYGIERIGAASGNKYIGPHDWFREGTNLLIEQQDADGSWRTADATGQGVSDTAFALLFLSHGRAPVLVNKLNYAIELKPPAATGGGLLGALLTDPPAETRPSTEPTTAPTAEEPWNQRPRDIANLVYFTGSNTEYRLNWQIVNLNAPVEELLDAPVLFISGNKTLRFTPAEEARLKAFLESGGMILANSDCPSASPGKDPFTQSVLTLGQRLTGRRFRVLPPSHPMLSEQQYKSTRWPAQPVVWGLSNGVRELIVLAPAADPGKAWERNATRTDAASFELGSDICLYAVDKQMSRYKGQTHLVKAARNADRSIRVARVMVGANPDPEPGGWRRLDAVMHNEAGVALTVVPVVPAAKALAPYKVAHLTGTTTFELTSEQRAELKRFVSAGGTLIVDAAGGSSAFADAAEKELAGMFGGTPGALGSVLPPSHALYALPGMAIKEVAYRNYMRRHASGRLDEPRLRGIAVGGRTGVLYSREDLSAGLVGQPVDGILGYAPNSATAIMRNLILAAAPK